MTCTLLFPSMDVLMLGWVAKHFFLYLFTVFAKTKVNKNEQIKKKEVEMRSRTEQLDRVKNLLEENLEELKKMQEAELETAKR